MTKPNKVMYKAIDTEGKTLYGYVEASTNCEAINTLKIQGYRDILLYENALFGTTREDLANINPKLLNIHAKLDITMFTKPNFWSYCIASIQLVFVNQVRLFIGLILLGSGIYFGYIFLIIFGGVFILLVPYLIWNDYMFYNDVSHMNKSYVEGNWSEASRIVNLYKKHNPDLDKNTMLLFDIMQAKLDAMHISGEDAYETIAEKYLYIKEVSLIDYYLLLLDTALLHNHNNQALQSVESLLEHYPKDDGLLLLKAFIFILLDESYEEAKYITSKVDESCLELFYARAMYYLLKAILIQKDDKRKALEFFYKASQLYDINGLSPAFRLQRALVNANYLVALCDNNQKDEARNILNKEWKILSIHGDKVILNKISEYFPEFKR